MREYISIEQLTKISGLSKATVYRKLKDIETRIERTEIIKKPGKKTLYKASTIINFLKNKNDDSLNEIPIERPDKFQNVEKLATNKYIERIEKELDNYKKLLDEKNQFIKEQNMQLAAKEERHDTIIMTMSKQLESLNQKLLLEDKSDKEIETFKYSYLNFQTIIKALTISILIIIYIKVLYL